MVKATGFFLEAREKIQGIKGVDKIFEQTTFCPGDHYPEPPFVLSLRSIFGTIISREKCCRRRFTETTKGKKWRLGRKSPFVPLKICLPLLLSQPRRTDQTGTTRLPNDRSERPVLTNGTRPLSIEVKPSHDHKMIKLPAFDNLFPP